MWVIPRARVVLPVDALLQVLVTSAGKGRMFQYLQQYFEICLFLQLSFFDLGEYMSFLGRTKERSALRKKETLLLRASLELRNIC